MKTKIGTALFAFLAILIAPPAAAKDYGADLGKLKRSLHAEGYDTTAFSDSRFCIYEDLPAMRRKGGKVDYLSEEFGYCTEKSYDEGRKFMAANSDRLAVAERIWRVGREHITAILKLETDFGKVTGKRYLLGTFASAYLLTERKSFAKNEIKVLLSGKVDPFLKGSFFGAFGIPQSIPSSWGRNAVDFDSDGKLDPYDMDDAIGFVGNYLSNSGFSKDAEKSIYRYNNDRGYVEAVMTYARNIGERKKGMDDERAEFLRNLGKDRVDID